MVVKYLLRIWALKQVASPVAVRPLSPATSFQCCGRVTRWQTRMQPGESSFEFGYYSIIFQVWRPGPAVESDGCYSLVGEDVYNDVILTNPGRLANRTVDSSTVISVQPGDVVGFFVFSAGGLFADEGIQLKEDGEESVWYSVEESAPVPEGLCPFPVETYLSSSTTAGPVISIDIGEI